LNIARESVTIAIHTASNNTNKYCQLSGTHFFTPVQAIETACIPGTTRQLSWSMQELVRRAITIAGDPGESTYLFQ